MGNTRKSPHMGAEPPLRRGPDVDRDPNDSKWFWATLMLSSISIVAVVFAAWELVENRLFRDVDYVTLHYLYITRGIASSLLLALWAGWFVLKQRRRSEEELRRSREHYRHLIEASPGAIALYDSSFIVTEWNATAEQLYGFSKVEVLGRPIPTIPLEREAEARQFVESVGAGAPILDVETMRRDSKGAPFEVQLSLLPFREAPDQVCFLEVTTDIRERVRLRRTLLEVEKLTSMGKMAAGTAHHLNTPLAALLLRVEMMRERMHEARCQEDLVRIEDGLRFCRQFVQRLLEFSRRPAPQKQPEDLAHAVESVVSFLAPSFLAKHAHLNLDLNGSNGGKVFADRNLLEALLSILLSNAADAISEGGDITIRCDRPTPESLRIEIHDSGCGISPADLDHVFEPFFTTKGPGRGTGLGLPIARNIVVEHGGSINLESAPEQGTTAIVELPVWRPESAPEGAEW